MTRVNPVRLPGCWECGDRRLKLFSRSGMIKGTNVLPMTYWQDQSQTGAERKHQVTSRPLPGLRRLDRIPGHDSQSDSRAVSTWSQKPPGLSMVFKLQGCLGDNRHPSYSPKKRARSPKACIHRISMNLQDGQRSVGAESSPKTAQILSEDEDNASHACVKSGESFLLPPEAGYRGLFISLG